MLRLALLFCLFLVAACGSPATSGSASPTASATAAPASEAPTASATDAPTASASSDTGNVDDPGTKIEVGATFGGSTSTTTVTTTEVACTREGGAAGTLRITYTSTTPDSALDELSILIPDTASASPGTTEFSAKGTLGGAGGVAVDLDQGDLTSLEVDDSGSTATVEAEASADSAAALTLKVDCLKIG